MGTQSIGVVSKNQILLKNLAERSSKTFHTERKIVNIQRHLERSRRATNPKNYNVDGTFKKGQKEFDGDIKEWSLSKDDGKLVYDLDLKKDKEKHEVTIDAKNGKVLNNEQDN